MYAKYLGFVQMPNTFDQFKNWPEKQLRRKSLKIKLQKVQTGIKSTGFH